MAFIINSSSLLKSFSFILYYANRSFEIKYSSELFILVTEQGKSKKSGCFNEKSHSLPSVIKISNTK